MKATQKDFAAIAPRAAREANVFFLCGPDEAGVFEAAARITELLADPGERVELSGADLRRDPVRLGDEARSTSLFGDSRHIFVRASGDEAAEAVEILLGGEAAPCPVLIAASGATDKSKTAKLLADRKDALVAMFWPPDLKSVAATVRQIADKEGVRIDGALAERIARAAGLDVRLARSEIEKMALYLDASASAPRSADPAVFDAIGASTEEDGFMPIVNAVLGGETGRLAGELRRMRELGLNPVAVLLAFERRAAQLAALAAKLGPRGDTRALIEAEKAARRIFWKDERDLGNQLKRWRGKRLERLVDKLTGLHRAMLANSQAAELLLCQGLAEIARAATPKN
ncbi:DNA polymerase III subunit delta [Novosphingobium flavum]|uniref:DNA-directed DNA polymerase n=1 Tax=Novosphingobium flavum TaxID=1778672 RepID=A0A7X1FP98_9SPHN|nr:DNA polymerase III subunit delta [Novosphingobium flavum]MBC2664461.1 DNA polymerase III subunit delta [Novosphingobium flavum]